MRVRALISSLVAAIAILGWWLSKEQGSLFSDPLNQMSRTAAGLQNPVKSSGVNLIVDLDRYDDPDYAFSVAIPAGWRRIIAAEPVAEDEDDALAWSEPGYAVGFESPRSGPHDRFADYILIEVLPGNDTGLFTAAAENRQYLYADEESIAYDKLMIDSESDSAIDVDLVIFQRGVQAMGYTLGFYAIGEPANERALFDAFQVMVRTFKQTADPFVII